MFRRELRYTLFPYTTLFRSLENVFLYDIDDLQAVAAQAAAERRGDIPAAERIVSEEVERFWAWYGGLVVVRSEEHTSELQSRENLVCRLLLEKKKNYFNTNV